MKVAVTGAAGYIGSRVVADLAAAHPEWSVTALDNFYLGQVQEIDGITVSDVDVRDRMALEAALEDADAVLHLAAVSGVDDCENHPDLAYESNVLGTNNVAWFCRKTGAGLVFPYSMAVLGDPQTFPITADHPRDPMNWYGRTKLLGERAVEAFADGAFPAHLLLKSNLYGEHRIDDQVVSKGTVINFFVNRVFSEKPLTVYAPGTQSRNYIHVKDIAAAYVRSAEHLATQLADGETGISHYEIASDEDPSVHEVATLVQRIAREEAGIETDVTIIDNPRGNETLVQNFGVDTTRAREELGWRPTHTVEASIRELIRRKADADG